MRLDERVIRKVPAVALSFWVAKIFITALGRTNAAEQPAIP